MYKDVTKTTFRKKVTNEDPEQFFGRLVSHTQTDKDLKQDQVTGHTDREVVIVVELLVQNFNQLHKGD